MDMPEDFIKMKGNREVMVKIYKITPIRRFQCVPGRPVYGLYHPPCTHRAYQFTAQKKGTSAPIFTFFTGHAVGNELLALLKCSLPPLETWEMDIGSQIGKGGGDGGGGGVPSLPIDPFNIALLRLLNLFFLRHKFDPSKPTGKIFEEINRAPGVPLYRGAKQINSVLIRFNETSATLVGWLTSQVNAARIRPYDFSILHNYLQELPLPLSDIKIGSPY
ncbi:hypothetical protein [Iodobacter fluviatilis]|uniref:Uncharacterized protein n=1 Tax=Iodobacter fluviatilis TaxID=537 RepID=A0A377SU03_9NEIS|nr:hypothetical protein [Iodobacter fluviatilis]TCU81632.1 hypothetical protein EV682_12032 [Iodobacter fluviatilis]STR44768.1 Uncharacterised protein [Iodobacter fluviatilis]